MNWKKSLNEFYNSHSKSKLVSIVLLLALVPISAIGSLLWIGQIAQNDQIVPCDKVNTGLNTTTAVFLSNEQSIGFTLEVAQTPDQRSTGLMCREYLAQRQGMLFVFDEASDLSFWMKNTYISLDIIFLDQDFNIVTIHQNALPNNQDIIYSSTQKAKYVIELNAGTTAKFNIKVGDKVKIN